METRYYKIQEKGEHYKCDVSAQIVISWQAIHKSTEYIIAEIQSNQQELFDEYELFYGDRLQRVENTSLTDPEDWELLIGDYYEGEDEYDPDKIMKRKTKLQEQLQNLIPVK